MFKNAPDLLRTAADTMEKRSAERDQHKERAMAKTVAVFNAMYPDNQITELQGWAFMVFLKMSRASQGAFRLDDYIDTPAYAALMGECAANQYRDEFLPLSAEQADQKDITQ